MDFYLYNTANMVALKNYDFVKRQITQSQYAAGDQLRHTQLRTLRRAEHLRFLQLHRRRGFRERLLCHGLRQIGPGQRPLPRRRPSGFMGWDERLGGFERVTSYNAVELPHALHPGVAGVRRSDGADGKYRGPRQVQCVCRRQNRRVEAKQDLVLATGRSRLRRGHPGRILHPCGNRGDVRGGIRRSGEPRFVLAGQHGHDPPGHGPRRQIRRRHLHDEGPMGRDHPSTAAPRRSRCSIRRPRMRWEKTIRPSTASAA